MMMRLIQRIDVVSQEMVLFYKSLVLLPPFLHPVVVKIISNRPPATPFFKNQMIDRFCISRTRFVARWGFGWSTGCNKLCNSVEKIQSIFRRPIVFPPNRWMMGPEMERLPYIRIQSRKFTMTFLPSLLALSSPKKSARCNLPGAIK